MHNLRKVFNLTTFRTNQLEAITGALEGRDVFVLMPTGGGKSLCFQLPAICMSGKTKGVSVVVSPLLALMKDQVDSLVNKQIDALLSNSETTGEDWQRLVKSDRKPKLWYVTPEKLRDSPKVNEIMSILHRDGQLARFIVDEAHCISTWGQDFRDAYTALGTLRDKYPSVPIMALTATANKRTVADIITQLKLKDHAFFTQSFNRTNLKYTVQRKKSNGINDIISFIESRHHGEGGVIYCNSRQTCETVAQNLRDKGLSAAHFHAGMLTQEKDQTVRDWQSGTTSIIVATIAFGMGIDKANVRFVIHRDMPKSLSGYYQETGRAGRDGKPADCLMFFSASDLSKLIHQIKKTEGATPESIQRQENAVREVYQFCENTSECRRVQILQHFDEKFTKAQCGRGCDTCEDGRETVSENVTTYAHDTLKLVQVLVTERGDKITLPQLRAILAGANTADIRSRQYDMLPQHGLCSKLPKELVELMLNRLMLLEVFENISVINRSGFHNDYLRVCWLFRTLYR
ncbi:hypothetical protein GALMADRAFT_60334 [Galerina marginata CBS 339.88]|uniref:ATP-dependent DNA helicase n=1 Tax=Galerina marginata (strain CBS 339.88) TaxID=685588 RepID=A0A067TNB6_GALM3|nr:hypothetical protein GALMADRAFT_60334 [Galerina marginata CBS 339.88]